MFHLQITKNHVAKLSSRLENGLHLCATASHILEEITIRSLYLFAEDGELMLKCQRRQKNKRLLLAKQLTRMERECCGL